MERKGYAEEQTINYYQVDQKGTLSPAALLSALQNAAIDHSDTLGYTLDYLEELQWRLGGYQLAYHGISYACSSGNHPLGNMEQQMPEDAGGKRIFPL